MSLRRLAFTIVAASVLVSGCKEKAVTPPDVILRVGERMVTLADFKRYLDRNAGTDLAQLTPEVASAMLDQFAEEVILSEYASQNGIEVPAEKIAEAVRQEAGSTVVDKRDEMRRQKLIAKLAADVPEASDAEVMAFYQQNAAEFRSDEQVRVRQILVRDEQLASDIAKKLAGGGDFAELSSEFSRAPNAKRGGEIGFVTRGELPKMFEEQIFALQPGEVSEVIRTDASYHIFKVDERRPAGVIDVEAAAPLIRTRLREEAIRSRVTQIVGRSLTQLNVAVLTRRLPFQYSGGLPTAANE